MTKVLVNPFSKEYYEQEKAAFQPPLYEKDGIKLSYETVSGRIDGYMRMDFLEIRDIPVFEIDGKTWMSLTPMEAESHYMPILLAKGRVGVAGLGMGYYVQRILDKPEVNEIVVYEIDPRVIAYYKETFGEHSKLTIVQKDVRTLSREKFDFFYCDIYHTILMEETVADMAEITARNKIAVYHFWSIEQMLAELVAARLEYPAKLMQRYIDFLTMWQPSIQQLGGSGRIFESLLIDHDIL